VAPEPASLVRFLCTVPRPEPGGVPAGRVKAQPSKGASRMCVELTARCKAGKGFVIEEEYIIKLTHSRPVAGMKIRSADCVPRAHDKAGTSGP
jgi:hypothetical protein